MNGGPVFLSLLGGTRAQVGVFGAALILTRVPQYVISPAIGALLPHASRVLATEGSRSLDRFVARAVGVVGLVGVLMVTGTWLLGEWSIRLFAGEEFDTTRGVLVSLALLAAFYLLSETLSQALFALGRARRAALGWLLGLLLPNSRRPRSGLRAGHLLPDGSRASCRRCGAGYRARGPGDPINHSTVRLRPSSSSTSARQPSMRSAFVVSA